MPSTYPAPSLPVFHALQASCQELAVEPQRTVVVMDTPLASQLPIPSYVIAVPSCQTLAVAVGVAVANPALKVFAVVDASQYQTSISVFLSSAKQNHNIVVIVRNPEYRAHDTDQLSLLLTAGGTFLARGFAGESQHLATLIKAAIRHDGFAVIDCIEPAAGSERSYAWYRQNTQKIKPLASKDAAWQLMQEKQLRVPLGIYYQKKQPSFQSELLKRIPAPLVDQPLKNCNIKPFLKDLK